MEWVQNFNFNFNLHISLYRLYHLGLLSNYLRGGMCSFLYFAGYMLKEMPGKIEGFEYITMLFCNQSPLEGQFSSIRGSNHDFGHNYAGQMTRTTLVC